MLLEYFCSTDCTATVGIADCPVLRYDFETNENIAFMSDNSSSLDDDLFVNDGVNIYVHLKHTAVKLCFLFIFFRKFYFA